MPDRVKTALRLACAAPRSSAKKAISAGPAAALAAIGRLLARGASALDLDQDEALFVTGFNPNDAAPGRLRAALAELQAAVFLAGKGYTGLSLIPQRAGTSADISGLVKGEARVFEVRSIGRGGPLEYLFGGGAGAPPPAAVEYLARKYDKKMRQLNCARKRGGLERGGLIFSLDLFAPADPGALRALAGAVHAAKGSPRSTAICLLAGDSGIIV